MVWPSQQRRVVERMPERRGIALALTASFMFCGIGFGSAVAGWVYPVYGYTGVLSASLLFFVMATVCLAVSYSQTKAAIPVM
jgi:DHA1 family inner membrane transport protein